MSEQVTYQVSLPDRTKTISLFPDDTIETIRMRIGVVAGVHPDRMRIYVQSDLPEDYYSKDSRRWEILFLRMSPEGRPLKLPSLRLLSDHTDPAWSFDATEIDKDTWLSINSKRESSFTELRMLGTTEDNSWIFPLDNVTEPPYLPPAARVAVQSKALFKTLHPYKVKGFKVIIHEAEMKPTLELTYYPLLRSGSPALVPEEISRAISRQDELLNVLTARDSPAPTRQTVLRARWKIPLVDTDLGQAVRNRFEQIFYGATVNKNTPAVSFFASKQEQSRHKFFTDKPNSKEPLTDLRIWQYWWGAVKPTKNKPSVIFLRGNARFSYDRITVNPVEIVVSAHRLDTSDESLSSIQAHLKEWLQSIDGLAAFIEKSDLDNSRWELQDVSVSLKYSKELKEGDFRRFGCLRGIYEIIDHDKLLFKLLRSDQSDVGMNAIELRVVQLFKDNPAVSASEVAGELGIDEEEAAASLTAVREKLEDNPDLLDRQYSNLPSFKLSASQAVVTYAIDVDRIVKYINILREILMNPGEGDLDDVCPSRMETVETAKSEAAPVVVASDAGEGDGLDFLDDLLGEIAQVNTVAAPVAEVKETEDKKPAARKVTTKGSVKTLANYLLTQLREFDPETYDPDDPQVLRKCDKPRQPIVLTPADMSNVANGDYDPRNRGAAAVLNVRDPDGYVICPAYWCTYDRIPLTEEQLGDAKACPVCGGKVRSTDKAIEKTQDVIEYPVIQRDPTIAFPGYVKYKSKKNDRPIPCCFTTAQTTKVSIPKETVPAAEAFYVLGESKTKLASLRLGYIPRIVGRAMGVPLNYKDIIANGNRIQGGQSGFFRVGIGHASETLPAVIQFTGSIKPPIQNADATMRCSFFRTWRGADEDADESVIPASYKHRDKLARRVASIDKAFKNKLLTPLEELEYSAIALDCTVFVMYATAEDVQMGCFMSIGAVRSVNRAIAVMIGDAGEPEYISHVARVTTSPQFNANLFKHQIFPVSVIRKLGDARLIACITDVPTIDSVLVLITSLKSLKDKVTLVKVILDPYGRAQAIFIPELVILPFKPTSQIPTFFGEKIIGYSDIPTSDLPHKPDMIELLAEAARIHPGFKYAHDIGNRDGLVVELVTASGLRVPVQTEENIENGDEVTQTIRKHGEDQLVWGDPDPVAEKDARTITYEAELFEFLLYQLSYDIQHGEEYRDLGVVLSKNRPTVSEVGPLLKEWMDSTLTFVTADEPPKFVQKMRTPCSKDDCSGSLCAWNGSSCRVEVKKVKASLNRSALEKRLLSTLISNEKIRDIVWQHKASPFFSSILYLELPTELILSDVDISKRLR